MKRVKTITAGEEMKVTIRVEIISKNHELTRWEMDTAIQSLTSSIMRDLPDMRYARFFLSEIKIK